MGKNKNNPVSNKMESLNSHIIGEFYDFTKIASATIMAIVFKNNYNKFIKYSIKRVSNPLLMQEYDAKIDLLLSNIRLFLKNEEDKEDVTFYTNLFRGEILDKKMI